jgi:Mrp family chromosome partitioning ATPase
VSEVVRGQSELSETIQATGTDNLSVITAGRWDRMALASLANGAVGPMFKELRTEFDFVIVDAAPILPVADTRFISQHVDSVILSIFRDVSQAPKVQAACEILEAFGVEHLEAVVTGSTESLRPKELGYESSVEMGAEA